MLSFARIAMIAVIALPGLASLSFAQDIDEADAFNACSLLASRRSDGEWLKGLSKSLQWKPGEKERFIRQCNAFSLCEKVTSLDGLKQFYPGLTCTGPKAIIGLKQYAPVDPVKHACDRLATIATSGIIRNVQGVPE